MTGAVTPFPKERQAKARGKPDLKAAAKELDKEPEAEGSFATVQSEAAKRVAEKRAAKVEQMKQDGLAVGLLPPGEADASLALSAHELPLAKISHGKNPREHGAGAPADKSLLDSVKMHGVLQPIRVRPAADGMFTIIAGHRRYEAARAAKLPTIPVVVAVADDTGAFTQALVENLQREDLNPLDEAKGFQQLLAETGKSQEEVGKLVGRSQAYVSNSLRILGLEDEVKEQIEAGKITTAHAKALASLEPERQKEVAKRVVADHVTSKQVEEIVRDQKDKQKYEAVQKEQQAAAAATAVRKAEEFVAATEGVTKETLEIRATRAHIVEALQHDGFKASALGYNDNDVSIEPPWTCECTATNVVYDEYRGFRPACVVEAHEKAYRKERDKERQKANAEIGKKLTKARNAIGAAVKSKVPGDALNLTGQRVALYLVLTSGRGYGHDAATEAFVRRHGGAPRSNYSGDYGDVWEVCQEMTAADLASEFAAICGQRLMPNVWTEMASGIERDWKLRDYLRDQKLLDAEAVFGPKGMSDAVKRTEKERAERAKADAAKAEAKAAVKKAEKVAVDAAEAGEPLPEPSEEEPDLETDLEAEADEDDGEDA